jgi:putative acyl-CoA dehydrogenase
MASIQPVSQFDTHEVFNQPPPFEDVDLFSSDRALIDAVKRAGGDAHGARLAAFGRRAGSAEVIELGFQAIRRYLKPLITTAGGSTR